MSGLEAFESVAEATRRFADAVSVLSDEQVGGPTLIPPWTRGHVITHIAQAADSYRRLLAGAIEGVEAPQYPSMQFRADQITGTQVDLLAWLSGRTPGDDLEADGDEAVPGAPYWI